MFGRSATVLSVRVFALLLLLVQQFVLSVYALT